MFKYRLVEVGEPAPWFRQSSTSRPDYHFDTAAGRYIVLFFFGSSGDKCGRNMLKMVSVYRALFDDDKLAFFGVSTDPDDEREGRVHQLLHDIIIFIFGKRHRATTKNSGGLYLVYT